MSQKLTTSAYGKAFLWLVAIAIALLVEGYLTQQFAPEPADAAQTEISAPEAVTKTAVRVERFANTLVELSRLFRTVR